MKPINFYYCRYESIAAVVVTYNRLELLKSSINGLLNQTKPLDKIIVINNSSTDGTEEWLLELAAHETKIQVITQENTGSSGGQYTGALTAYNSGFDWIWLMDDDVVVSNNCLENMLPYLEKMRVCQPLRYANDGSVFCIDMAEMNLTNPVKSIWKRLMTTNDYLKEPLAPVAAVTFEGPIFHRSLFEMVGFPAQKFFIYGDDTEFSARLAKQGVSFVVVRDAVINRLLPYTIDVNLDDWKFYYIIRNLIAIDVLHGNIAVRVLRPFGYFLAYLKRCRKLSQVRTLLRAFKDGYFYKEK